MNLTEPLKDFVVVDVESIGIFKIDVDFCICQTRVFIAGNEVT